MKGRNGREGREGRERGEGGKGRARCLQNHPPPSIGTSRGRGKGRVSWAEEEVKGGNGREEWKEGKDGREGRERREGKGAVS